MVGGFFGPGRPRGRDVGPHNRERPPQFGPLLRVPVDLHLEVGRLLLQLVVALPQRVDVLSHAAELAVQRGLCGR